MESYDFRVTRAREFLAQARQHKVAELSPRGLAGQAAELRRLLGWVIDVVDDYADTDLDLEVSQAVLWGGVYLKPADVLALCPDCRSRVPGASGTAPDGSRPADADVAGGQAGWAVAGSATAVRGAPGDGARPAIRLAAAAWNRAMSP